MIGRTRERAHLALVRELAECKCGMTQKDLLDAAGISSGGNGKRYLEELEQSGFVQSEVTLDDLFRP